MLRQGIRVFRLRFWPWLAIYYLSPVDDPWHLYLMASVYGIAGIFHFIKPSIYLRIIPPYLPRPRLLVSLSGMAEILLGIGIGIPAFRDYALLGIIGMLLAFLPVHFHMLSDQKAGTGIPQWLLVLRLPLQFGLIYWAYAYL